MSTTIGRGTSRRTGPGLGRVKVTLTSAGKRTLQRARGSRVTLQLRGTARDAAGNVSRLSTARLRAVR